MLKTLFEGKRHKITTDGRTFFLYTKAAQKEWELRDSNTFDSRTYAEALKDVKKLLKMGIPEEEKILKMLQSGFFSISNL
jgi:hypothetical protein